MNRPLLSTVEAALAKRALTPEENKHARNLVSAYIGHANRVADLEARMKQFVSDGRASLRLEPCETRGE